MLKYLLKPHCSWKSSILLILILVLASVLIQVLAPLPENFLVIDMPLQHADAIVVMGGSQFEQLPAVADLFKRGMAPRILLANDGVFAAWSEEKQRNLYQVEWAEEGLVKIGVPREKIVRLPFYGSSTMFDVLAAKKYLMVNGMKTIIVVTSDYHTRRTYWTFRHELENYISDISIFPAKSLGVGMKGIVVEYVKLVYYILKYGLLGMVPDMNEVTLKKGNFPAGEK